MSAPGLYYGGLQVVQLAASQDGERGAEDELRRGSVPDLEPDARRCFWQLKQVTLVATSYITVLLNRYFMLYCIYWKLQFETLKN